MCVLAISNPTHGFRSIGYTLESIHLFCLVIHSVESLFTLQCKLNMLYQFGTCVFWWRLCGNCKSSHFTLTVGKQVGALWICDFNLAPLVWQFCEGICHYWMKYSSFFRDNPSHGMIEVVFSLPFFQPWMCKATEYQFVSSFLQLRLFSLFSEI